MHFNNKGLLPLTLTFLCLSSAVNAQTIRHIADPLNLTTTLGAGFVADVLKVAGRYGWENQKIELNTNFGGDKWNLSYLYSPQSSLSNWNVSAAIKHGKTDTEIGRFNHYQYQVGIISEFNGWMDTAVLPQIPVRQFSNPGVTGGTTHWLCRAARLLMAVNVMKLMLGYHLGTV